VAGAGAWLARVRVPLLAAGSCWLLAAGCWLLAAAGRGPGAGGRGGPGGPMSVSCGAASPRLVAYVAYLADSPPPPQLPPSPKTNNEVPSSVDPRRPCISLMVDGCPTCSANANFSSLHALVYERLLIAPKSCVECCGKVILDGLSI
jgi:hypothetical protein